MGKRKEASRTSYEQALDSLRALQELSGVPATFYESPDNGSTLVEPKLLFSSAGCSRSCPRCSTSQGLLEWSEECLKTHLSAGVLSDRHGGKYVYICPENNVFIAAPVMSKCHMVAVMMLGPRDVCEDDPCDLTCYKEHEPFEARTSAQIKDYTYLLAAIAANSSDDSQSYLRGIGWRDAEGRGDIK